MKEIYFKKQEKLAYRTAAQLTIMRSKYIGSLNKAKLCQKYPDLEDLFSSFRYSNAFHLLAEIDCKIVETILTVL